MEIGILKDKIWKLETLQKDPRIPKLNLKPIIPLESQIIPEKNINYLNDQEFSINMNEFESAKKDIQNIEKAVIDLEKGLCDTR